MNYIVVYYLPLQCVYIIPRLVLSAGQEGGPQRLLQRNRAPGEVETAGIVVDKIDPVLRYDSARPVSVEDDE